jgi:hypothetical protein
MPHNRIFQRRQPTSIGDILSIEMLRKQPRRRIATGRPRPLPATGAGYPLAYDFVYDAFANGQQLRCLTIIDESTLECMAIDVAGSIRSSRVIEVLSSRELRFTRCDYRSVTRARSLLKSN